MQTRLLGALSFACLVSTALWLIFLVAGAATAGPLTTFEQVLSHIGSAGVLFYATYVNAALITIAALLLFGALYVAWRQLAPTWTAIAMVFVPVYGALNLVAYLSQITVVPRLLQLMAVPEYRALSELLLRQTVHQWPDSTVYIVNNLAYAVLGVPSIVFGVLMYRSVPALRLGGGLLALSGVACIVGFIGIGAQNALLGYGSRVGGVLFLFALVPMTWVFMVRSDSLHRAAVVTQNRGSSPRI